MAIRSGVIGWAVAAVLAAGPATAQARVYRPGDMVQMEGGEAYRIVRCEGTGEWDDCEVEAFQDGKRARTGTLEMSVRNLRAGEERRRAAAVARGEAPPAPPVAPAPRPPAAPRPAPLPPGRAPAAPAAGVCSWQPPAPPVTARTAFSQAVARRRIYDGYSRRANGTGSAPLRVGVAFLAYAPGGSYRNTVANVPGQGAQRRHAGAPVGATVHTFRSRHMVCEEYRDGVERRMVEGTHSCFIDRDGEWSCASENDTRITQMDRE